MTTKHNRPAGANGGAAATITTNQAQYTRKSAACSPTPMRRADGRIVGELRGDVLSKHAKRAHMLQRPPAWAWDCAILDAAERAGARFTEIECDGRIYRAALSDFQRYGFPVCRGHGDQRGLPLTYWHVRPVGQPPAAVQLTLWGDR